MENIQWWVIEQYSELDYWDELLVGSISWLENLPPIDIKITHEYHQPEVSNSSCSIHAWIWVISNLYDNFIRLDVRSNLRNQAIENWAWEWIWWYIYKAVDLIRNWNNKNYNEVTTFKIKNWSEIFYELIEKWYICQTWYKWDMNWIRDKNEDWVLDETFKVENPLYWHSVDIFKKEWDMYILDSYKKTAKYNIYRIQNFNQLVKNKAFFENSYFYIPNTQLKMEKSDIEFNAMLKLAKQVWISNCKNLLENITREQAIVMIARCYKLIKKELEKK